MAFQLDIGFMSLAGTKPINEDFCAAMLPEAGQVDMGCIVALADGVSTGGMGKEAAQTTVTSLVRDYYCTRNLGHHGRVGPHHWRAKRLAGRH